MQVSISIDLQMVDSVVRTAMYKLVPINMCVSAASGSKQIELGSDILSCCIYLKRKIQIGSFDNDDYQCYLEMKSYYNAFISNTF